MPACLDVINKKSRWCILPFAVALILSFEICDALTIGPPAGLTSIISDFDPLSPIDVHIVDASNLSSSRPGINNKTNLCAVRRNVRIHLINISGVRKINGVGTTRVYHIQLPIVAAIRFAAGFIQYFKRYLFKVYFISGRGSIPQALYV